MKKSMLAALCCLPLSLLAQQGFTIHGKLGTLNKPARVYLNYSNEGKKIVDSAEPKNGTFTFSGNLNSPSFAEIFVKYDAGQPDRSARQHYLQLYIENAEITITGDSLNRAKVEGSVTNDENNILNAMQRSFKKTADSLTAAYNRMTPAERSDSNWRKAAGDVMRTSQAGYDSVTRIFIEKNPNSFISLQRFEYVELAYNFNVDTAAAKFEKFPAHLRESYTGRRLMKIIETARKTSTGQVAMDFTLNDSTGKAVSLSDFRGKYVLIDFWASWCKPCRAENPVMLAAYNKYKDKNFTILGISLDEEDLRKAWLNAVKQDKLPWTQVADHKSRVAAKFGVSAIPANFLLDPNGKIIGRNLRGEDLGKKLNELFPM